MTISNALAPKFALGGHYTIVAFFGSITCVMTGFNMFLIPPVASSVMLPTGVSG
jgi:archaellum biogenesis protein FlaJ (TadC family)